MLKSVTVKNFKCYKDQKFDLSNLNIFCGNNSVGKSTAIQAFLLAIQNDFSDHLQLTGDFLNLGAYRDVHNKFADYDSLSIKLCIEDGFVEWGYEQKLFDDDEAKLIAESPLPLLPTSSLSCRDMLKDKYKEEFIFLSAERWGPRSYYPYSTKRRSDKWLGIHGEYTPQLLSRLKTKSDAFVDGDPRIHKKSSSAFMDVLYEWMGEISPGIAVDADSLLDADISTQQYKFGGQSYRGINVGFGLSYSLPIVLALLIAKPGSLVIIENPEAHLHPKGQSYLGRLITYAALSGVQIIIETHSDHLLNGIRVAARVDDRYKAGIAKVFFISSGLEQSNVVPIDIGEMGELSVWPEGFFDQQAMDVRTLMKGQE